MKRSSLKLTKRLIDRLEFQGARPDSQDIRWDAELAGFGVRVYKSGRKAFVLSYRHQGRKHIMKLGDYGPLTLDQARRLGRKRLSEVLEGEDPLERRRAEARGETVADLCALYMERHATKKRSGDQDQRRIGRHILPAWGRIKVKSVKRSDVAKLHHAIGETAPYEANRLLALVRKIFSLAQTWGLLEEGAPNPAAGVEKFREKKRDRWVKPEELPRLAEAIDLEPNVYARAALWLYLLTGARKSELLGLEWSGVDLERREIRLADTKAGRTHYIPLSEPATAILGAIPRLDGNPYVFPGRKEGGHLVNIAAAWQRVRKAAAIEDVRLHDLRRTVGSWLATSGASLPLIGKVLNHSNPSTTAIYARLAEDPTRKALEDHGSKIMEVAKGLRVEK